MNQTASSSNARWSAVETTARGRSSDRLKKLLYQQDLGRSDSASRLDSSSHTMPIPAIRRTSYNSLNSLGSMSSISDLSSIGSLNNRRFTPVKSPGSKLLRYHNKDSMNSLLSLNSRWKSTPPKKRNSATSASSSKLLRSSMILSPIASGSHSGRWMATASSDSAIDRPISAIRRKASLNTILPSSA